jgi:hypothetical protein
VPAEQRVPEGKVVHTEIRVDRVVLAETAMSLSLGSKKRVKNAPISMRQHPDFNEHIVPNYRRSIP